MYQCGCDMAGKPYTQSPHSMHAAAGHGSAVIRLAMHMMSSTRHVQLASVSGLRIIASAREQVATMRPRQITHPGRCG